MDSMRAAAVLLVIGSHYFGITGMPANLWQNLTLGQYILYRGIPDFPPTVIPLWSLPIELEIYLILPLLFLLLRNRPVELLAGTWCVATAVACFQYKLGPAFTILRYIPCFLGA